MKIVRTHAQCLVCRVALVVTSCFQTVCLNNCDENLPVQLGSSSPEELEACVSNYLLPGYKTWKAA